MSHFSCLIQQDSAAHRRSGDLERRLIELHSAHYPSEEAQVAFHPIPAGAMFTEGRQSTSSIITCSVGHRTEFERRERYMRGVCDLWTEITGCTDHEIVVAVAETAPSTSSTEE